LKRIGLIFTTDASGQDGEQSLDAALARPENRELLVVDREHYNTTDISVGAQLARLKVANPQVIVAWGTGAPLAAVLRGANDLGLSMPFAVSAANLNYSLMNELLGFLPPTLLMVSVPGIAPSVLDRGPLRSAASAYYDTVKASGKRPDANMINGWDPTMIVLGAFQKLGFDASAEQIRNYIANLHDWYGAAGQYDFRVMNQRGLSGKTMLVVRFDRATQTFVPASRIGGEPLPNTRD
jgi:branched-chain amino acid transport system substrate-binding protein